MSQKFDDKTLEFTKNAIKKLDDNDWLTNTNFSFTILLSEFDTKDMQT